jgi:hypothetical protein
MIFPTCSILTWSAIIPLVWTDKWEYSSISDSSSLFFPRYPIEKVSPGISCRWMQSFCASPTPEWPGGFPLAFRGLVHAFYGHHPWEPDASTRSKIDVVPGMRATLSYTKGAAILMLFKMWISQRTYLRWAELWPILQHRDTDMESNSLRFIFYVTVCASYKRPRIHFVVVQCEKFAWSGCTYLWALRYGEHIY